MMIIKGFFKGATSRLFSTAAPRVSFSRVPSLTFINQNLQNLFSHLKLGPPDPIFGIVDMFQKDTSPNKVNLSIGVYRNEDGRPHVFRAVRKAEDELVKFDGDKEYVPGTGEDIYVELSKQLLFGENRAITDRVFFSCAPL